MVDKKSCVYDYEYLNDDAKINKSILANPFEKFERKRFIYYAKSKDFNTFSFNPSLWQKIKNELDDIKKIYQEALAKYYQDLGGL